MGGRAAAVGGRRAAFWGYVCLLFLGTHWPRLQAPGPEGSDKIIHVIAFGLWTALLIGAGFFGPALSLRNIGRAALIAPLYAAVDESSQAIPALHRTAAWDDYAANLTGIALACLATLVVRSVVQRRGPSPRAGDGSILPPR